MGLGCDLERVVDPVWNLAEELMKNMALVQILTVSRVVTRYIFWRRDGVQERRACLRS
jgi:hypothetical protein